jgi:hypothetical protein
MVKNDHAETSHKIEPLKYSHLQTGTYFALKNYRRPKQTSEGCAV